MVFCRAYPVKKPVPIDRVTTASTCEGEFGECSLYREALARAGKSATEDDHHYGSRHHVRAMSAAERERVAGMVDEFNRLKDYWRGKEVNHR